MARLLLITDLHLSTTGPSIPPACPNLESIDVDAVISVGDVIDDNIDHTDDEETGEAYEKRGREFFERLNEIDVPVFTVPGNHDPLRCTKRLTDGLENVTVAHRCAVGGETTEQPALDGLCFVGWGCEQFDLTPAFQHDRYPGIVPNLTTVESVEHTAKESAARVESVIGSFLAGEFDAKTASVEIGVASNRRETCAKELDKLKKEYETIRGLLSEDAGADTKILLSHPSPFNVSFDYHHSADYPQGQLHRGSIPLKMAVVATGPDIVFSGHTHTQGRDAIETVDGYADLYNPGSPGVAFVEVDTKTGSMRVVE
jgi:Icc-related predicted phosphoesterase